MGTRRGVPARSAPLLKRRESLVATAWSGRRRKCACGRRFGASAREADPEVTVRLATWFVNPTTRLATRGALVGIGPIRAVRRAATRKSLSLVGFGGLITALCPVSARAARLALSTVELARPMARHRLARKVDIPAAVAEHRRCSRPLPTRSRQDGGFGRSSSCSCRRNQSLLVPIAYAGMLLFGSLWLPSPTLVRADSRHTPPQGLWSQQRWNGA